MAKKKQKTTMLVRGVPLDVSERIRRYCRRDGIKYREFVGRAIDLLEGSIGEKGQDPEHGEEVQEQVNPIERVAQIADNVKTYKNVIRLKKDLISISKDIKLLAGREHQAPIYLEVVRMTKELDEIIAKYVPKHEIPDNPKEREAMGLPDEGLLKYLVTAEEAKEIKREREEADRRWKMRSEREHIPSAEELREKMEKLKREFRGENLMAGLKPDEDSAKPLTGKDEGQRRPRAAATAEPYQGPAKVEAEAAPGKKQVKATRSGTEVGDGMKGREGDD